jgi:hypothetical protein
MQIRRKFTKRGLLMGKIVMKQTLLESIVRRMIMTKEEETEVVVIVETEIEIIAEKKTTEKKEMQTVELINTEKGIGVLDIIGMIRIEEGETAEIEEEIVERGKQKKDMQMIFRGSEKRIKENEAMNNTIKNCL